MDCVPKGEKDSLITQEAAAAMGASHPHLVTTYKYAIKYHEKGAVQADVQVQEDGKPLLPGTCECWLFMEMCNKGTLQVLSSLHGELFVHPSCKQPTTLPSADNVCAFHSVPWAEDPQRILLLTGFKHTCRLPWPEHPQCFLLPTTDVPLCCMTRTKHLTSLPTTDL